ncbi:MAG: DUF4037 domain-containing protein [Lachnospiraceae bacterium]|nr:DUF4037 domain-containing protein [Lachnospiraceae bacterium]
MNGLALSRDFYEEYGKPLLTERFPELLDRISVGLLGAGSEVLGYDDALSEDHDFTPDFCIFLPGEDVISRREAFLLERGYNSLPKEYKGVKRAVLSPAGGARRGVLRLSDFLTEKLGVPDGELTIEQWLQIPSQYLLEVTGGELFYDGSGEFSAIREKLACYPEDVRKKRLAGHLVMMAQAGTYNVFRCLAHKEPAAAQLAVTEFVTEALESFFLLENRYLPYYKWRFRALRDTGYRDAEPELSDLLNGGAFRYTEEELKARIQHIFERITDEDPGKYAYGINDSIRDPYIRNLHILYCV